MGGYVGSKAVILSTTAADVAGDADIGGSITVAGTVDGRDIAADGAKLDGIEANANVTDTANVTAAGAVMDSELTSEVSVKALDQGVSTTDSPSFVGLTADKYNNDESLPDIRPSLLLDFANSKTLDPRITFTRGSTATYWDGKTTAKAEENLAKYSEDSTQSPWNSANGFTTSNATTAPNGETTADKFTENTDTDFHNLTRGSGDPISVGVTYTISLYLKNNSGTRNIAFRGLGNGGIGEFPIFNIVSGTIVDSGTEWTNVSITDVGSGWYRCVATTTATGTFGLLIHHLDGSTQNYTGDGSSSTFFWGLQIEARSSATAYTATTSTPIVKYQPVLQTAASGEARFDHDPVTGESKGLLIEEARTNLYQNSEVVTDTDQSSITSNTIIAPDGTLTADKVVEDTQGGEHGSTYANNSYTSGTAYTFSVFAKADDTRTAIRLLLPAAAFTNNLLAYYDLSSGVARVSTNTSSNPDAYSIEDVGNGWYRCSITGVATITATSTATQFRIIPSYASDNTSYTGDGYSGVFLWGAQLEEGSFPTSYIPTSGSTVTRAVDSAEITGSNFTDWFSANAFTLYRHVEEGSGLIRSASESTVTRLRDSSYDNAIALRFVTDLSAPQADVYAKSFDTNYVDTNDNSDISSLTVIRQAFSIDETSILTTVTGDSAVGEDTTAPLGSSYDQFEICEAQDKAWFRKIAFYPKKLTSAQLLAMMEE